MTFSVAVKDIESRFQSIWGSTTRWTTDGDVSFTPPTNAAWVRLNVRSSESEQVSLGNTPRFRHYGVIIFQVFVPITKQGFGARTAYSHADTIAGAFRNVNFGSPVIYCRAPNAINIGERDGWYQVNLEVPYYWDEDF